MKRTSVIHQSTNTSTIPHTPTIRIHGTWPFFVSSASITHPLPLMLTSSIYASSSFASLTKSAVSRHTNTSFTSSRVTIAFDTVSSAFTFSTSSSVAS